MKAAGRQLLGLVLAIIGFLGSIIICALPYWKYSDPWPDRWETETILQGLWRFCSRYYPRQCQVYNSLLDLPHNLQAARVLVTISIIVGVFGIMFGVVCDNCTSSVPDKRQKSREAIFSGVFFIIAGICVFIPVCWTTITTTLDFYKSLRMEISIYIGWCSAGLLLLGGGLLCSSCPFRNETIYKVEYSNPRSV